MRRYLYCHSPINISPWDAHFISVWFWQHSHSKGVAAHFLMSLSQGLYFSFIVILFFLFDFITLSLPPLNGDHLYHLGHLPVILLVHHHLNDTIAYPKAQHWQHSIQLMHLLASSAWYWHRQLVLSWYHHQPESHQQSFKKLLYGVSDIETPGSRDP